MRNAFYYVEQVSDSTVGSINIKNDCEMRDFKIKAFTQSKILASRLVTSSLKFPQQCNESVIRANRMMGLIKRIFSFKDKDVVLPLYNRFVRPHL